MEKKLWHLDPMPETESEKLLSAVDLINQWFLLNSIAALMLPREEGTSNRSYAVSKFHSEEFEKRLSNAILQV
jgi:hypothetical protein